MGLDLKVFHKVATVYEIIFNWPIGGPITR